MTATSINQTLKCELVEKELIEVQLYQVDLINRTLVGLTDVNITDVENNDVLAYDLSTQKWINKELSDIAIETEFVYNEVPINIAALPSKRFRIANICKTSTLQVYFNGIKEKNITIHSTTEFSLPIDSIIGDDITVDYIKD